jgi:hypothetical protein
MRVISKTPVCQWLKHDAVSRQGSKHGYHTHMPSTGRFEVPLRENGLFFSVSLCLSRACLGKKITFIYKMAQKARFYTCRPVQRAASLVPTGIAQNPSRSRTAAKFQR